MNKYKEIFLNMGYDVSGVDNDEKLDAFLTKIVEDIEAGRRVLRLQNHMLTVEFIEKEIEKSGKRVSYDWINSVLSYVKEDGTLNKLDIRLELSNAERIDEGKSTYKTHEEQYSVLSDILKTWLEGRNV